MKFVKLHGLGNDFLIADASEIENGGLLSRLAGRICDRHSGVGADGIIFYEPLTDRAEADFSARIFNADGSEAEMSGNGVRCLGAYLWHSGRCSGSEARIRTVAGIKRLDLQKREEGVYVFRSSMGQPIIDPALIPARVEAPGPVLRYPLHIESETVAVTLCSMGNPHCSTFWPNLDHAPVARLGPLIEHHACFPNRTNVEFIQVVDRHHLRVFFWERGVGRTMASGTGSSAAAVAGILNGFAESPVTVLTELGALLVEWAAGTELFLTGPAEFICSGDYAVPKLAAEDL